MAPAASLAWLVEARPRAIASHADLLPALEQVLPAARVRAFAAKNGGVDLLDLRELVVAGYPGATLWLVSTSLDPNAVEAAFGARTLSVEGRSVDWAPEEPLARIVRTWGTLGTDHVALAIFGRDALGVEVGRFGPLRAAELFAEERIKRASPALRTEPLAEAARRLGDAPVRAFAPGPFDPEVAKGLGGLLGATTAVALAARPVDAFPGSPEVHPALAFTVILVGGWKDDAAAAAERLQAAYTLLANSGAGQLLGLDHPVAPPRVRGAAGALTLEVTLDAYALARGLKDATAASVDEIMGH
jgi:hypothetical protein